MWLSCSERYDTTLALLCCQMPRELALIILGYWGLRKDCLWWSMGERPQYRYECFYCGCCPP